MHNSITVSFIKNSFTVIVAVRLKTISQVTKIATAKEANEIANAYLKKYKEEGVEIEIFQPW